MLDSSSGVKMCGSYDKTWSNPQGEVLVEVAGGQVWAAERPFVWNGIDVGEASLTWILPYVHAHASSQHV